MTVDDANPVHGVEAYSLEVELEKLSGLVSPVPAYKSSARIAAIATGTIAIVNLAFTIWGLSIHGGSNPYLMLYQGDCRTTTRLDMVLHLIINALSTTMLCASSYCMQCLCAPTRGEVDKAHESRMFLTIGIPSAQNFKHISGVKLALWIVLALTSTPIHLLYNSAVYYSRSTNDYKVMFVAQAFLNGKNINTTLIPDWPPSLPASEVGRYLGDFQRLSKQDCMRSYAEEFVTSRSTVVLITTDSSSINHSNLSGDGFYGDDGDGFSQNSILASGWQKYRAPDQLRFSNDLYGWICGGFYNKPVNASDSASGATCKDEVRRVLANAETWKPYGFDVEYCLSKPERPRCALHLNTSIIAAVTMCNVLKVCVMLYVAFGNLNRPLLVVGDAVASFLRRPDYVTDRMCWAGSSAFSGMVRQQPLPPGPRMWKQMVKRNVSGEVHYRWVISGSFLCSLLVGLLVLLVIVPSVVKDSRTSSASSHASGDRSIPREWAVFDLPSAMTQMLATVVIINSPQLIQSIVYFILNGLWTSMFLETEWDEFGVGELAGPAKTLRVSQPRGEQRQTYFLQLPCRVAIPMAIANVLMHWLVSQSLYLVVVSEWSYDHYVANTKFHSNSDWKPAYVTSGHSSIALLGCFLLGVVLFTTTLVFSQRALASSIPAAGGCSAAISAACHPPAGEDYPQGIELRPLRWGVMRPATIEDNIGHCGFSSDHVEMPVAGMKYA